jgi:ATP-dependent Zn protease
MSKRDELKAAAYHEAGHAVVAYFLDFPIKKVTIIASEVYLGCYTSRNPAWFVSMAVTSNDAGTELQARAKTRTERSIIICLAGVEGEKLFTGEYNKQGASFDSGNAYKMAERLCLTPSPKEIEAIVDLGRVRAKALVRKYKNYIKALALELLKKPTLKHSDVKRVVAIQSEKEFIASQNKRGGQRG